MYNSKLWVTAVAQRVTAVAQRVTAVAQRVTAVAQWAKAPGIHCYVAGSIPAATPRYCTKKIEKCSSEHKKTKEKKVSYVVRGQILFSKENMTGGSTYDVLISITHISRNFGTVLAFKSVWVNAIRDY